MSSMHTANTVAFISPMIKPTKKLGKGKQIIDPAVYLPGLLHSTLELEEILKMFFEEAQATVPCASMTYRNEAKNVHLNFGMEAENRCDYRIFTEADFLGELFFTRGHRFSEKELKLFESLIGYLVASLRNALCYREAVQAALKDPLTGAGNRLALDNSIRRELQLAHRHQHPFSILMIDIDDFKKINDTYGHQAGDKVLQSVAEGIVAVTRQTDMVFRYGGEEFLVILSKTDVEGSRVIAERIRSFIANDESILNDTSAQVTISIGAATLSTSEYPDHLINRADQALYIAKKHGKNRVEYSNPNRDNNRSEPLLSV